MHTRIDHAKAHLYMAVDWDVQGTGFLTFDAFLSITAMDMKRVCEMHMPK